MKKEKINRIRISDRVNVVCEFIPDIYSFSLGIFFSCGSRDEEKGVEGKTHFLEHMLFKGTNRRSASDLFKRIESLGGVFDAYTTKENTIILTRFLREYQEDVIDIVLEILNEAAIPEDEFEKEKSIILEEIKSSREDPEDRLFDLLFETSFDPHPISNPVIGYPTTVKNLKRDDILNHFKTLISQPITISVAGNFDNDALLKKITGMKTEGEKLFDRKKPAFKFGKIVIEPRKDISQVYVLLATKGIPFVDSNRYLLSVISSALGGGMSSRLFLRIREREGLAYNIQTVNEFFSDIGIFGIYFVTDQKNLRKCLESIRNELITIGKHSFTANELNIHRSLVKGNFLIGLESTTNRMLRLGKSFSMLSKIPPIADIIAAIDQITVEKATPIVQNLTDPSHYSISIVGKANREDAQIFFES